MKTIFLFDVDGTLTPARQQMTAEFEAFFKTFCQQNLVFLATGSNRPKMLSQISQQILDATQGAYTCSGAEFWIGEQRIASREHEFDASLVPFIETALQASSYPFRYGRHVELRTGMLNVSVPGRNASLVQREHYFEWDKGTGERDILRELFAKKFSEYEFFSGGQISIDIVPRDWTKAQIIPQLHEIHPACQIVFFGDRIVEGGNDEPLASALERLNAGHIIMPVSNPEETFELLQCIVKNTAKDHLI